MVVDDDVLERMGASDMFNHAGYRVLEAGNAAEALRLFETNADVRVLFSDVSMPGGMSGAELALDVARRWPADRHHHDIGPATARHAAVEHALSRQALRADRRAAAGHRIDGAALTLPLA